ncbi:ECF transporter S component [Aquibacillus halophilus]|uniref:ECF transporter S component n=1 Tax=Aquibacillus halophilus TaxID=930132 RepID=A0A6A8DF10_9BACI|nr:ECF transporter S component [Aquibacillus halophilus]
MNTYKITLIALLAALAVVGRFMFQFIPNVQPVTTLIIISGFFLGPASAIILAVLVTYLSNLFLGMGIWTIWQIVAWAAIGLLSGWIGKTNLKQPIFLLVAFGIFCGYFYGFIVSLATFTVAGKFLPYYIAGLPFDTYHAVGNALFMIVLYPVLTRVFTNYNKQWLLKKNIN